MLDLPSGHEDAPILKNLHPIDYTAVGTRDRLIINKAAFELGIDVVYNTGPVGESTFEARSRFQEENTPENLTAKLSEKVATLLAKK